MVSDTRKSIIKEMFEVVESSESTASEKAGAYILLNDTKMATRTLDKMTTKEREEFCSYPIYYLYNNASKGQN